MVRTYKVIEKPRAVSVDDLTVEQLEEIEEEVGEPLNQWGNRGSLVKVLRLVLAAGNGTDPDAYRGWTLRQLKELATLDGDAAPAADATPEEV